MQRAYPPFADMHSEPQEHDIIVPRMEELKMTEIAGNTSVQKQTKTTPDSSGLDLLKSLDFCGLSADSLDGRLQDVITRVSDYFQADHGYVMLRNEDGDFCRTAAAKRNDRDDNAVTASNTVIEKAAQTGTVIAVADAMNNEQFSGDPEFQRFNINCALCAPIKTTANVSGMIYLDSTTQRRWDTFHSQLLEVIAGYAALAVESIQAQEFFEANKRLIATGKATLNLSHSVKNILQMVGGAVEVIDFGLRSNQMHRVKRSWDILKPNLERMRKYTLEMLDYSKERKLKPEPTDFNRVIQGAIESLKSQLKAKNSKINIRIDQKIPEVFLDSERIHEMALNLVLNAIDVVADNGGLVSVETKYHPDEERITLVVTDNGHGMSEEMKEKIFTPFESDKKSFGTGLGMPIAKQIIDQHKATIEINSELGRGTTFTVCLPTNLTNEPD